MLHNFIKFIQNFVCSTLSLYAIICKNILSILKFNKIIFEILYNILYCMQNLQIIKMLLKLSKLFPPVQHRAGPSNKFLVTAL